MSCTSTFHIMLCPAEAAKGRICPAPSNLIVLAPYANAACWTMINNSYALPPRRLLLAAHRPHQHSSLPAYCEVSKRGCIVTYHELRASRHAMPLCSLQLAAQRPQRPTALSACCAMSKRDPKRHVPQFCSTYCHAMPRRRLRLAAQRPLQPTALPARCAGPGEPAAR